MPEPEPETRRDHLRPGWAVEMPDPESMQPLWLVDAVRDAMARFVAASNQSTSRANFEVLVLFPVSIKSIKSRMNGKGSLLDR